MVLENKYKIIKFDSEILREYDIRGIVDENINDLSKISEIDGFIIGGASINPKKFIDIIKKSIN